MQESLFGTRIRTMKIFLPSLRRLLLVPKRYSSLCQCPHLDQSIPGLGDYSTLHRRTYSVCKKWSLHCLRSRGLVRLKGQDVVPFLQGLVTNDITKLGDSCRALYSMMLNVQGRVLNDMIIYQTPEDDGIPCVLVEVDQIVLPDFLKTLRKYKIRKKVDIADASGDVQTFAALPRELCEETPWLSINQDKIKMAVTDPRVENFSWRLVASDDGKVKSSIDSDISVTMEGEDEYHKARYKQGIPEGVKDLPPGDCLPLESNLVFHNGVSFTKGCYIGQELTARTHHTGVTRKRLIPLVFDRDPKNVPCGSSIVTANGKAAGKFRNAAGVHGLGLVRLAYVKDQLQIKTEDGEVYSVVTSIPPWWPQESEMARV